MKPVALRLLVLGALLAPLSCGEDFKTTAFPRIQVMVVNEGDFTDEDFEVSFGSALQLSVEKNVRVINPGTAELEITSIDWQRDAESGLALVNPYVSLELAEGQSFPILLEAEDTVGVSFKVRYQPPIGSPLDDFSPSILLFESNARNFSNKAAIPELRLTFSMQEQRAYPRVEPKAYTFQNATPTSPETQTFFIVNDLDLATAPFSITDVLLGTPSDEFTLSKIPNAGTVVLAPNNPAYAPAEFQVTYRPVDDGNDQNMVIVKTDAGETQVTLDSNLQPGNYTVQWSCPSLKFDFSTLQQCVPGDACGCVRRLLIYSEGPGPLRVDEHAVEPDDAKTYFGVEGYKPATAEGEEDILVTSWPQALQAGRSLEFEVTYTPGVDFQQASNGKLVVTLGKPDTVYAEFDLFAGKPKPLLTVAPANKVVAVSADFAAGESGLRHVVINNFGNGALLVKEVATQDVFGGESDVFQLVNAPAPDTTIAAGGLLALEISWDTTKVKAGDIKATEGLRITYVHGLTEEDTVESVQLSAFDKGDNLVPVANPGTDADYPEAAAGEPVTLRAIASDPGSGEFLPNDLFSCGCFFWYLTAKPVSSGARLSTGAASALVEFTPDVAGDYTIEVLNFATVGSEYLYSDPGTVTLTVD